MGVLFLSAFLGLINVFEQIVAVDHNDDFHVCSQLSNNFIVQLTFDISEQQPVLLNIVIASTISWCF